MTITLDGITLPADLDWPDRYSWSPVVQSLDYSLTGAPVIQEAAKTAGREITLVGDNESAWVLKSVLDQLLAKANTANLVMTLTYYGTSFNVMFRRNTSPIDAQQIVPFANPQDDDYYSLTLRFIEV